MTDRPLGTGIAAPADAPPVDQNLESHGADHCSGEVPRTGRSGPRITAMDLFQFIESVGKVMDAVGVAVIAGGALISMAVAATRLGRKVEIYRPLRRQLGASILLGLEFLVAADIIRTVAVTPELRSVLVLGAIVLIRTFLSYSLQLEVTGYWPWQGAKAKADQQAQAAVSS